MKHFFERCLLVVGSTAMAYPLVWLLSGYLFGNAMAPDPHSVPDFGPVIKLAVYMIVPILVGPIIGIVLICKLPERYHLQTGLYALVGAITYFAWVLLEGLSAGTARSS
jgi:hypothetical protein